MSEIEQAMRESLDGKFFAFVHNDAGGMKIQERKVSKDWCPTYNFTLLPMEAGGKIGGLRRAAKHNERVAAFWTPEKVKELRRLRRLEYSARKMGYLLGISRHEVGVKLNKLGVPSLSGKAYHAP